MLEQFEYSGKHHLSFHYLVEKKNERKREKVILCVLKLCHLIFKPEGEVTWVRGNKMSSGFKGLVNGDVI